MAVYTEATASVATATITLASVATNTFALSSAVDNSTTKYPFIVGVLTWKTGAAGTTTAGFVNIYLVRSVDGGTIYEDNNKLLVGSFPVIANATTYIGSFDTRGLVLGDHFKLAVENQGGGTSDTTAGNFSLKYQGIIPTWT